MKGAPADGRATHVMIVQVLSAIAYLYDWLIILIASISYDFNLAATVVLIVFAEFLCNVLPLIVKNYKSQFTLVSNILKNTMVFLGFIYDIMLGVNRPSHYFCYLAAIYVVLNVILLILSKREREAEELRNRIEEQKKIKEPVIVRTHNGDTKKGSTIKDRNMSIIKKIVQDNIAKSMYDFPQHVSEAFELRVVAELIPFSDKTDLSLNEIDQAVWKCLYNLLSAKIPEDLRYREAAEICENHIDDIVSDSTSQNDVSNFSGLSSEQLAKRSIVYNKINGLVNELLPSCSEEEKTQIIDDLLMSYFAIIDDPSFDMEGFLGSFWEQFYCRIKLKAKNDFRYRKAAEMCEENIAYGFHHYLDLLEHQEFSSTIEKQKLIAKMLRNDISKCMSDFPKRTAEAYVAQVYLYLVPLAAEDMTFEQLEFSVWKILCEFLKGEASVNPDFSKPLRICEKNIEMLENN